MKSSRPVLNPDPTTRNERRTFRSADGGVVGIEVALLALPFFLLIFAIIETAVTLFVGLSLDHATLKAVRTVRTGSAQAQAIDDETLRRLICSQIHFGVDCAALRIDLRSYDSFAAVDLAWPDRSAFPEEPRVERGSPNSIMVMAVQYDSPVMTDFVRRALWPSKSGGHLLQSVAVTRIERSYAKD